MYLFIWNISIRYYCYFFALDKCISVCNVICPAISTIVERDPRNKFWANCLSQDWVLQMFLSQFAYSFCGILFVNFNIWIFRRRLLLCTANLETGYNMYCTCLILFSCFLSVCVYSWEFGRLTGSRTVYVSGNWVGLEIYGAIWALDMFLALINWSIGSFHGPSYHDSRLFSDL